MYISYQFMEFNKLYRSCCEMYVYIHIYNIHKYCTVCVCVCVFFLFIDGTLLPPPSISEWVGAYLSLSDVLNKLQMTREASRVMQDATEQYAGTPDEARYICRISVYYTCK